MESTTIWIAHTPMREYGIGKFHDTYIEVIGLQMPQNVKGSGHATMREEVGETTIRKKTRQIILSCQHIYIYTKIEFMPQLMKNNV